MAESIFYALLVRTWTIRKSSSEKHFCYDLHDFFSYAYKINNHCPPQPTYSNKPIFEVGMGMGDQLALIVALLPG